MKTCKDCLCIDACAAFWHSDYDTTQSVEESKLVHGDKPACKNFKDRTCHVELPCAVGDPVFRICPQSKRIQYGDHWNGKLVERPCQRCAWECADCSNIGYQGPEWDHTIREFTAKDVAWIVSVAEYFGKIYFTNYPSAKEYLEKKVLEDLKIN